MGKNPVFVFFAVNVLKNVLVCSYATKMFNKQLSFMTNYLILANEVINIV